MEIKDLEKINKIREDILQLVFITDISFEEIEEILIPIEKNIN